MNEEEKEVINDMYSDEAPGAEEQSGAKSLTDAIREYVRRGNVSRIIIKHNDNILVNLPLNAGIVGGLIGAVAAPWALITAAIATAGFACKVEIVKDDGEVVDLQASGLGKKVQDAGATVFGEIRRSVDDIRDSFGADGPAQDIPVDEEIPFDEPQDKAP